MSRRARRVAVSLVMLVTALVAAPFAGGRALAHNGVGAAFKGKAGPYVVYAYDGYPNPGGALAYRLVVLVASDGEPASDVAVRVSATPLRPPGAAGTAVTRAPAQVYANVVFYELSNPYPGDWRVTVRLSGRPGVGTVSFPMHGMAPVATSPAAPSYAIGGDGGGPSWPLVAGGAAAGVVVLVGVGVGAWLWRRRRGRAARE